MEMQAVMAPYKGVQSMEKSITERSVSSSPASQLPSTTFSQAH
jgi:hypothetical protein